MIVLPARRAVGRVPRGIGALSTRERQVLDAYISYGDQKAVAGSLCITLQTVKNHISHILDKLDCTSSLQAAVLYDRWRRGHVPALSTVERRAGGDRRQAERRRMAA